MTVRLRSISPLAVVLLFFGVVMHSAAQAADTVTFYHTDALGTPVMESNATGVVTYAGEHKPYGEQALGAANQGPGFTGHVRDVDTGLIYMQQRYYDPSIGRFASVDPIAARHRGDNFNRYAYVGNNPYSFVDPNGMDRYLLAELSNGGKVNTVVTDGNGGLRVHLGNVEKSDAVLVEGVSRHENKHITDFYERCDQTCGIVVGAKEGLQLRIDEVDAGPAEGRASDVEIAYLRKALLTATPEMRKIIRNRINEMKQYKTEAQAKADAEADRRREAEEEARRREEEEARRREEQQRQNGSQ